VPLWPQLCVLYGHEPGAGSLTQLVMKTLQFKTNINCGGCIKAVTPTLNQQAGAGNWQVDTANPDKILTVSSDQLSSEQVVQAVEDAGFKIQAA
jgi:copper chaperone